MDIDYVLRSFEIPRDQPLWERALLAKLCEEAEAGRSVQQQERFSRRDPMRTAVILDFARPAAA